MLPSLRDCLHVGGGPQIGEVTCGGSPHLSCTLDQIKMRHYVNRRVTSPSWGPPLACKQALRLERWLKDFLFFSSSFLFAYYSFFFVHLQLKRQIRSCISVFPWKAHVNVKVYTRCQTKTRLQNSLYFCVFKYATREQSNKRSGTRLKTESETWGETLKIRLTRPGSRASCG